MENRVTPVLMVGAFVVLVLCGLAWNAVLTSKCLNGDLGACILAHGK